MVTRPKKRRRRYDALSQAVRVVIAGEQSEGVWSAGAGSLACI